MIRIPLVELKLTSEQRPDGYLEDCLSRGVINGGEVEFEDAAFIELVSKYRGGKAVKREMLLGDWIAVVANPIARVLGIKGKCRCDARRKFLNNLHLRVRFYLLRLTRRLR